MTESQETSTEQQTPLLPLPGGLDLLPGAGAAGYCADGVCHIPASHIAAQKTE
ncbi:hypothetical protein [Microbacterium aurantiacum]|uniref:hypothetical protein n=1 Tax=Microbacterium aurantiacum TaxID=162393 RepID=UPI0015E12169|nr:hypothetical protein [Microbacterium aurantiacum]